MSGPGRQMIAKRAAVLVEQRQVAAPGRRYAARPDDRAELALVIATMRDVPREALDSFADMFHLLRRLSGRLQAVSDRLEVRLHHEAPQRPRTRLSGRPAADHAAIIAGVFGKAPRAARERTRTITTRRGRTVRVLEKPSRQLELAL